MSGLPAPRPQDQPSIAPPPPPLAMAVPSRTKVTNSIEQMVRDAHARQASDIHIRIGELPRFRVRGQMVQPRDQQKVTPELFKQYLGEILSDKQQAEFEQSKELDTAIFYPGFLRCRVNCFETLTGGAIVLRLISLEVPSILSLGLPEVLKDLVSQPQGLILVTGPTGSGNSTTLAAMLRHLNENMTRHVVTIEDPIEYVHPSQKCLISQREVGLHTHEFHQALRAVLREDPDVILIGEMRDRTTVETALK
ncbi:MAG TPA: ATPase, T2SS/T4P/T4SS family, partial [Crinalium sp.]